MDAKKTAHHHFLHFWKQFYFKPKSPNVKEIFRKGLYSDTGRPRGNYHGN